MAAEYNVPVPDNDENVERQDKPDTNENPDRFESDTQRIIHRHLQDKDDVITDEDIANVRIGMTPVSLDEPTEARFEDDNAQDEVEEKYVGKTGDEDKKDDDRITPWDVVEPNA